MYIKHLHRYDCILIHTLYIPTLFSKNWAWIGTSHFLSTPNQNSTVKFLKLPAH